MPLQRRHLFLLFPAVTLGLTACPGLRPPGDCGLVADAGPGVRHTNSHGELLFPGAVSAAPERARFGLCPPGYDYPTVREVTVTTPSGATPPVTWHRIRSGDVAADFESAEVGEHRMEVTYEPDPATGRPPTTLSTTVVFLRERADAGRLTLPSRCSDLLRTGPGAWICDGQVIRDGSVVQELDAGWRFAADGPSVWASTAEGEVFRWLDTGAGPLQSVGHLPATGEWSFLADVSGDEVLVKRLRALERYVVPADGGTPQAAGTLAFTPGVVARSGGGAFVGEYLPDGGQQVCAYRLEGGAFSRSAAPCLTEVVGFTGAGGLWVRGRWSEWRQSHRMDLYRFEGGGIQRVAGIDGPEDWDLWYPAPGYEFTPDYPPGTLSLSPPRHAIAPAVEPGGGATLDAFPLRGGLLGVREDFVWTELKTDAGVVTEVTFR